MTTNTPQPAPTAAELRRMAQLRAISELTATVANDLLSVDPLATDATRAAISESINRLIKLNYAIFLVENKQDEASELFIKRVMENEWQ